MGKSRIEWTESTWNPVTGCTKISPGCANCYAERMAYRLQAMGQDNYRDGFDVSLHERALSLPLKWKKPSVVFVNSMSDLFHERIPFEFVAKVFEVMEKASWHIFQVLTKRSERLCEFAPKLKWHKNIWMGVSVENADYGYRISKLSEVPAFVRFVSFEPLIAPVGEVDLTDIDWVIVGGESGPKARSMKEEWVSDIQNHCLKFDVPFFFKQWGGINKKKNGRLLNGRTWDEMPLCRLVS
ncbi:MAG TPA: phage Gp37/Gp68 family protein [Acidobacteriota bacterium]|nr:phage Gp37/Gp68 family protein [Acidobacteriota bacterium]